MIMVNLWESPCIKVMIKKTKTMDPCEETNIYTVPYIYIYTYCYIRLLDRLNYDYDACANHIFAFVFSLLTPLFRTA